MNTGKIFRKNVTLDGQISKHSFDKDILRLSSFLDCISFTHFCTFTTSKPGSVNSMRRIAERLYNNFLEGERSTTMFWAAEKFEVRDGYHFHALLRTFIRPSDIFAWYYPRYGRCQIIDNTAPERMLSGTKYVAKYIVKAITDYDIYICPDHLSPKL